MQKKWFEIDRPNPAGLIQKWHNYQIKFWSRTTRIYDKWGIPFLKELVFVIEITSDTFNLKVMIIFAKGKFAYEFYNMRTQYSNT